MKIQLAALALILSACTTPPQIPPSVVIPQIEEKWLADTGDLKNLKEGDDLIDVTKTINENYSKYHILRNNMQAIREYIEKLKQIEGTTYGNSASQKD